MKCPFNKLLGLAIACLSCILAATHSLAESYSPPPGNIRQQRQSTGSRGDCFGSNLPQLKLLVPQEKERVLVTTQSHPVVLFHIDRPSEVPISVTLTSPEVSAPLYVRRLHSVPAGIIAIGYPPDAPPLEVGKVYVWTAVILCNPFRITQNRFVRLPIQLIALPDELAESNLNKKERAQIFARRGIWYDAITLGYDMILEEPENSLHRTFFKNLIEAELELN
ncbi:MAG: DUF928 domain-containing protein [Xenococcaceae cyanobacterium]